MLSLLRVVLEWEVEVVLEDEQAVRDMRLLIETEEICLIGARACDWRFWEMRLRCKGVCGNV
jgi:hypothetical protein